MATQPGIDLVDSVITERVAVRAFLSEPVSRETINEILSVSARSPSGGNAQPWHVHVLTGRSLDALSRRLQTAYDNPEELARHTDEYSYYPQKWIEPYLGRRREVGFALYDLLGIRKGEKDRMRAQQRRNYSFFGAPVGLLFTVDRIMGVGSLIDYGMFLQTIMIAAQARGLATCPQAAFTPFHRIISAELRLPESHMFVCGMSIGHADPSAIENTLVSRRAPVNEFAVYHD